MSKVKVSAKLDGYMTTIIGNVNAPIRPVEREFDDKRELIAWLSELSKNEHIKISNMRITEG